MKNNRICLFLLRILNSLCRPLKKEFAFFIFFLLAIMVIPIRIFVADINYLNFKEVFNFLIVNLPRAIIVSYLLTVFVNVSRYIKLGGYILATLLFTICLFLNLVFNKILQPDIITLLAETNTQESSEFLATFLLSKGGVIASLFTLVFVFLIVLAEKNKKKITSALNSLRNKLAYQICFTVFLILGLFSSGYYLKLYATNDVDKIQNNEGRYDAVTSLLYSLYSVHLISNDVSHAIEVTKNISPSKIVFDDDSLNVVYVIGESYIKSHSQLYGYYLPTTPNLCNEQKKGNLYVFDDVVSPFNQTTLTMKNTFNCNSLCEKEKWSDKPFFPAIFCKAGYDVYYWDVQKRTDGSEQALHQFSMDSYLYNKYFTENVYKQLGNKTFKLDGDAVSDFKSNAQLSHNYNLIIFHFMGQHVLCINRYPSNKIFNKFSASSIRNDESYMDASKKQQIAEYDNATYYNDYVMKRIFDMFRNKNAVILYFSDHGEEVYDYRDSRGRVDFDPNMVKQGLKYQFEVPFMIWCSDKYQKKHPLIMRNISSALHKPFESDDIYNVLFHLGGLETNYYRPVRDLISPSYVPKDRIVGKNYNYDKIMECDK